MAVKFCPIASGSSGNSAYVGTEHTHILIDAGLSGKKIEAGLAEIGVQAADLDAIFITHEHTDHIKGAGILCRRYHIPIYATAGTWEGMQGEIGQIPQHYKKFLYQQENCAINDILVRPFEIPHDAMEPVGFNVFADEKKITLATDLGHITEEIKEAVADSDILLLEANHDIEMLKNGSYPWHLKKRILGDRGHISNAAAGELLTEIMSERMKFIYLGHLSEENNVPHLAYETVAEILKKHHIQIGKSLQMDLAARFSVSRMVAV